MTSKYQAPHQVTVKWALSATDLEVFRSNRRFLAYARLAAGDDRYAAWLYQVDVALYPYGLRTAELPQIDWHTAYTRRQDPKLAATDGALAA